VRAYEYRHTVGFAETNLIGNVYYVHHMHWQGRCRELFLRDMAPEVLAELAKDLRLVTIRCSCEYLEELHALDEVIVRMRLGGQMQNRITMEFEYYRDKDGNEQLVAKGEQQVACMRVEGDGIVPTPVPEALRLALQPYSDE